jgi:hypothetical protein
MLVARRYGTLPGGNGEVKNLRLTDANIVGGVCGPLAAFNNGRIVNCSAVGLVNGLDCGGLVGWNFDLGTILGCYSMASVSGEDYQGGLVGYNQGTIARCYAAGPVTGTLGGCGGLVGVNEGTVNNCYSTGDVAGGGDEVCVGGLVGISYNSESSAMVVNCYSTGKVSASGTTIQVGGVIGAGDGQVTGCFWDTETSGMTDGVGDIEPDPIGATGKTTAEMKTSQTFLNARWYFVGESANGSEDIWCMPTDSYPRLSWEDACR